MILKLLKYLKIKKQLKISNVSIGYTYLDFPKIRELLLYNFLFGIKNVLSILSRNTDFMWKKEWILIGFNEMGDYIYIDTSNKKDKVCLIIHDMLEFGEDIIAVSFKSFLEGIEILKKVSINRKNPVKLKENPISITEKEDVLKLISSINQDIEIKYEKDFWEAFFEEQ